MFTGAAVAVTLGDRMLLAEGYGHTSSGEPVTGHTVMALASISKSFTALAVMQLVEAGRVELDAPVRWLVPEFNLADSRVDQMTVRHLLNHTSGLSDRTFPRVPPATTAFVARVGGWHAHGPAGHHAGLAVGVSQPELSGRRAARRGGERPAVRGLPAGNTCSIHWACTTAWQSIRRASSRRVPAVM